MELDPVKRNSVMPLPVTLISTISGKGIRNIAPYGCVMPVLRPLDLVCFASAKRRDTLDNVIETGEFVINLPGVELSEKIMPTAHPLPPEEDEFIHAGLIARPSKVISAPGIEGCYAWMECRLSRLIEEERYTLVVGKVVHLEVDDAAYSNGHLDVEVAKPLFMGGSESGMQFCTVAKVGSPHSYSAMFPNGKDPMAKR